MSKSYWHIQGYDGLNKIYGAKIKTSYFSERQIQQLLKVLVARAGLSFEEIVGACAKGGTKIKNDLLAIRKDGPQAKYSCGDNPYFTARIIHENA